MSSLMIFLVFNLLQNNKDLIDVDGKIFSRDAQWLFFAMHELLLLLYIASFSWCMNFILEWMTSSQQCMIFSTMPKSPLALHDFSRFMNFHDAWISSREAWIFSCHAWLLFLWCITFRDAWISTRDAWFFAMY